MISLHLKHSLTEIDANTWDALTGERLYISYGWLKTIEETAIDKVTPYYYLLEDDKVPVALAVCYESHKDNPFDLLNGYMLGKLERIAGTFGISFKPAFLCGPVRGNGDHVIVKEGLPRQQRIDYMRHLIETIEREAEKKRLSLFFTNVSEKEAELCKELQRRKYNLTVVHPKNRLQIKWSSFADYLSDRETLSKKNRETFSYEINKNRKAGVKIRLLEDLEHEERLYQLLSQHHYRLNKQPFPYAEHFFSSLRKNLGSEAMLLVAEREGEIIGVMILFRRGSEGWATFIGMDHNLSSNDFTYFNLAYYLTIDHAIQAGIKSLNYGSMLYRVKRRRGCTLEENYIFHRASSRLLHNLLRPWFLLHMTWFIKRKIPRTVSRL